jgi:tetratricopeptide (TPR) repeat protein
MAYYTEALEYFRHSLKLYGSDASTLYNMGMCYLCLHQLEDALECIDQASILDPAFDEARTMRVRIQAESNCWAGSENLLQVPHAQEATISRNTWPAR